MIEFGVADMTCGHCASRIARAVKDADAGARCEIDVAARRVRIEGALDAAEFGEAISAAGYTPVPVPAP